MKDKKRKDTKTIQVYWGEKAEDIYALTVSISTQAPQII
jgi:hypothetical protein